MDVTHLQTLRELRDRGSVTAVARALHLSPSAVSQQLTALQRTVAVPLTRQRGRVLVLTPAGERLADAAGDVIAALVRAQETVGEFAATPTGTVSVTAFHSAGLAWFPPLIAAALADPDGPGIACRDEDVSISEFVDLAAEHDVVIAHRPYASEGWPSARVAVTPLLDEPIDLALPRSHPLARQREIGLADLAGEAWLAAHEGFALEPLLVQAHAATTGRGLHIAHRVNEFNVAAAIIAQGGAIGLLPRYTGLPEAHRDAIVLRPISGITLGRHIDVLTRPEALQRRSVRIVIDRLRTIVTEAVTDDVADPRPS